MKRRVQNCQELLALHNKDPEEFPARLVTGDRSWFHHQTPQVKRQSMMRVLNQRNSGQHFLLESRWPQYSGTWRTAC